MKRLLDMVLALFGLIVSSIIILPVIFLVWLNDYQTPFYIPPRVGKNGKLFSMVKLRSMVVNADKSGVDSTSANDMRITKVGKFIRSYKLDELMQLWNVLIGDMSLVGPRPNVKRETDLYTLEEQKLLTVKPGITDFASIVFADEGEILKDSKDPDLDYNQLIRPWKSRLGLIYIENESVLLDLKLILLTVVNVFARGLALQGVANILKQLNVSQKIQEVSLRQNPLQPAPPPGSDQIVIAR